MKNFYIVANYAKKRTDTIVTQIIDYLTIKGAKCTAAKVLDQNAENRGFHYTDPQSVPEDTQCVIVLGGDGTLIQAAHDLRDCTAALIGINLGNLGYLDEVDEDNIIPAMDALLADQYYIEERMALEGEVIRSDGTVVKKDFALNDIVLSRKEFMKMVRFAVYVNGQFLTRYDSDGMIIATPTGSTAYSLSAGGPIVLPTSNLFLLTPICPHTINGRSIVLPEDVVIELVAENKPGSIVKTAVSFDSDNNVVLNTGDRVCIKKSQNNVKLARINKTSFLEILGKKLSAG